MAKIKSTPTNITVSIPSSGIISALDFPGSTWAASGACRFTFSNPLPAYPATYIWECFPRKQKGFYTTFFWGPDGSAGANNFYPDKTYYGAHPYPSPRGNWDAFLPPPELGPNDGHAWEIAVEGGDITGQKVIYDRWYVQALRVKTLSNGKRYHEYFTDLIPNWIPGSAACNPILTGPKIVYESSNFANPPSPGLVWGDAPWTEANGKEVFNGMIRGIRIYQTDLNDADLQKEICQPLSSVLGQNQIWYLKMNPDPSSLTSETLPGGKLGPTPVWSTSRRATLWKK